MERQTYRHRQSPTWFLLLILALAGIGVAVGLAAGLAHLLWSLVCAAGVLALLFGGLAVEVTPAAVVLAFGIGVVRRTIPRSRIKAARQVRNPWWYGFGIRLTPHGWMWNISGLDAVEIDYVDGGSFRIGTDDPRGLLAAIGAVPSDAPDAVARRHGTDRGGRETTG